VRRSARTLFVKAGAIGALAATAFVAAGDDYAGPRPGAEMHFARLWYQSYGGDSLGGRGGGGTWDTDWPEAEEHFYRGVSRLSKVELADDPRIVDLIDDMVFDYPWLYAVEVGRWYLSPPEAEKLREYLLRGGFLMVDDFHGDRQWDIFYESMRRVFPDRKIVDIEDDNEILHVLYDVDERIQVPGYYTIGSGRTYEGGEDGRPPHWRGIYDDDGRHMVIINHNMDLGDAWEHADYPDYPEPMTGLALRFAVNYVIYAMTH
jgi:hypothetical protein